MLLKMKTLIKALDGQGNGIVCFAGHIWGCFEINWSQFQIMKGKHCLTCYSLFLYGK